LHRTADVSFLNLKGKLLSKIAEKDFSGLSQNRWLIYIRIAPQGITFKAEKFPAFPARNRM
jgi:hypothetical protein